MLLEFSVKNRKHSINSLSTEVFDVLVIGGGITGAGIILDAASRGLKVALIEKLDFASGTSSKSTKLIHGGLRYLKQMDFSLVKEVGSERATVHKLAPHLVVPEKMLLPLIKKGSYGKLMTSLGLKVYDVLANVKGDDRRKILTKKEALNLEPLLPEDILKGAGYYAEYRTDDARLTIEVIKTGIKYGALALNYLKVKDLVYKEGNISGVEVIDVLTGKGFNVQSNFVVNAAGPWVDTIRDQDKSRKGKKLLLTKGVHLVVPKEKLPIKQSIYFDIPDGRMMFAVPRGKVTYFGTTDTKYIDSKDKVVASTEDVDYLVSAVNQMFPTIELQASDIISSWAGLRPLIHQEGKSESEVSRKDEVFMSNSGLISIAGGKLTGYRKMSERVVDLLANKMRERYGSAVGGCTTNKILLCGNGFKDYNDVLTYIEQLYQKIKVYGLDYYEAWYLVTTYGKQSEEILERFNAFNDENLSYKMCKAELHFAVKKEMVTTPLDFFIRRTGRLYFDIGSVHEHRDAIFKEFGIITKTSQDQLEIWNLELNEVLEDHSNFDNKKGQRKNKSG